jgi:hypothetical protein
MPGFAGGIRRTWKIAGCSTHGVNFSEGNAQENTEEIGISNEKSMIYDFQKVLI